MICTRCPAKKKCPEFTPARRDGLCCIGRRQKSCKDEGCKVEDVCETITKAGTGVAILEEKL